MDKFSKRHLPTCIPRNTPHNKVHEYKDLRIYVMSMSASEIIPFVLTVAAVVGVGGYVIFHVAKSFSAARKMKKLAGQKNIAAGATYSHATHDIFEDDPPWNPWYKHYQRKNITLFGPRSYKSDFEIAPSVYKSDFDN